MRTDLTGRPAANPRDGQAIACFAHITDLHYADVQSPARFEFFNHEYRDPRFRRLVPTQRAQEALTPHAMEALVDALNSLEGGPISGRSLDLVVNSGDSIDNGQRNELAGFLGILSGGEVEPNSGGPSYEGVQSPDWPDDIYWKPEGGAGGVDLFTVDLGFPTLPGLLERAIAPFPAIGLRAPWIVSHGNHEHLTQGVGIITAELEEGLVGGLKPLRLEDSADRDGAVDAFTNQPQQFMAPPHARVTPDPTRARAAARDFEHARYPIPNRLGRAYREHDTEGVRLILLDTVCSAGGAEGCLDASQLGWLDQRLADARAGNRLAVVVSHHGLESLTNARGNPGTGPGRYADAAEVLEVMHRHPNLVLWLNGHIHANRVQPRPGPAGEGGFWEVTTSSLIDWPCQARVVELIETADGGLTIACTMLDHSGPADPGSASTVLELAALHRQLAGNSPGGGFGSDRPGTPLDRNVLLLLSRRR